MSDEKPKEGQFSDKALAFGKEVLKIGVLGLVQGLAFGTGYKLVLGRSKMDSSSALLNGAKKEAKLAIGTAA